MSWKQELEVEERIHYLYQLQSFWPQLLYRPYWVLFLTTYTFVQFADFLSKNSSQLVIVSAFDKLNQIRASDTSFETNRERWIVGNCLPAFYWISKYRKDNCLCLLRPIFRAARIDLILILLHKVFSRMNFVCESRTSSPIHSRNLISFPEIFWANFLALLSQNDPAPQYPAKFSSYPRISQNKDRLISRVSWWTFIQYPSTECFLGSMKNCLSSGFNWETWLTNSFGEITVSMSRSSSHSFEASNAQMFLAERWFHGMSSWILKSLVNFFDWGFWLITSFAVCVCDPSSTTTSSKSPSKSFFVSSKASRCLWRDIGLL